MGNDTLTDEVYVTIYESIPNGTVTISHGYHETANAAKRAARGTCASGKRRLLARIRVPWREGQRDE